MLPVVAGGEFPCIFPELSAASLRTPASPHLYLLLKGKDCSGSWFKKDGRACRVAGPRGPGHIVLAVSKQGAGRKWDQAIKSEDSLPVTHFFTVRLHLGRFNNSTTS